MTTRRRSPPRKRRLGGQSARSETTAATVVSDDSPRVTLRRTTCSLPGRRTNGPWVDVVPRRCCPSRTPRRRRGSTEEAVGGLVEAGDREAHDAHVVSRREGDLEPLVAWRALVDVGSPPGVAEPLLDLVQLLTEDLHPVAGLAVDGETEDRVRVVHRRCARAAVLVAEPDPHLHRHPTRSRVRADRLGAAVRRVRVVVPVVVLLAARAPPSWPAHDLDPHEEPLAAVHAQVVPAQPPLGEDHHGGHVGLAGLADDPVDELVAGNRLTERPDPVGHAVRRRVGEVVDREREVALAEVVLVEPQPVVATGLEQHVAGEVARGRPDGLEPVRRGQHERRVFDAAGEGDQLGPVLDLDHELERVLPGLALDALHVVVGEAGRHLGVRHVVTGEGPGRVGRAGRGAVEQRGKRDDAGEGDDGSGRGQGGGTAASHRADAAMDLPDAGRGVETVDRLGVLVQGRAELVDPHRVPLRSEWLAWAGTGSSCTSSPSSTRSLASALAVWLFTVPTEQSRTRAVSASVRSSK